MYRNVQTLVMFTVLAAACGESSPETRRQELAEPGSWQPPATVLQLADGYDIANVQAGPWVGESGCSNTFQSGTRKVREWILEYWPQVPRIHGYQCRRIGGTNRMSVHGTGRALDIVIPIDPSKPRASSADNEAGDPLANYLLEHAEAFGIQQIIWDNKIWTSSRPPGSRLRNYSGASPHHDHIHVELNPDGAGEKTPWFDTPMGPPDFGPCGDPLGPEGGIIDDDSKCFRAFGPAQYWRTVDGEGHGDSLHWTNAWESDEPSNWARWNLELSEAGRFQVEYFSSREWAVYDSAQYRVRHDGNEEDVFIDLSAGEDGWNVIGTFDFAAGDDQWVSLYDNAGGSLPADQHIVADAIRLIPPPPEMESTPELIEPPDVDSGADLPIDPPGESTDARDGVDTSESESVDVPVMNDDAIVHGRSGCSSASGAASGLSLFLGLLSAAIRRRAW